MSSPAEITKKINNLKELHVFWKDFLTQINGRCILLLNGEVGAGKTTSVQMIAELLDLNNVQSPSFAIHLRYENKEGFSLDHVDLYRLKDDDDLESSGFWDLFSQEQSLIVIEWASRLNSDFLPLDWPCFEITLEKLTEESRAIHLRKLSGSGGL